MRRLRYQVAISRELFRASGDEAVSRLLLRQTRDTFVQRPWLAQSVRRKALELTVPVQSRHIFAPAIPTLRSSSARNSSRTGGTR